MPGIFDLGLIGQSLPQLWGGFVVTVQLTLATILGGIVLAVPLGILRASRFITLSRVIWGYTYVFRGTPMLIQLFIIYYGLAQFHGVRTSFVWPILKEGYWCCLIAFTMNTAAYTTEIIAGAIRNVRHEDIETGRAFGMSRITLMWRIILPAALRLMFPAYVNEIVFILQSTSLASLVTVMDLTGVARVIIARTFAPYELFATIGLIYLAATYGLLWLLGRVERRLNRHLSVSSALSSS